MHKKTWESKMSAIHINDLQSKVKGIKTFKKRKSFFESIKNSSLFSNVISKKTNWNSDNLNNNYLWIIFWVKKFLEILKSQVVMNKLNKLKKIHWDLINDNSYFPFEMNQENNANKVNNFRLNQMVK